MFVCVLIPGWEEGGGCSVLQLDAYFVENAFTGEWDPLLNSL